MFASLLGVYSKEETQCSWIFKCITCVSVAYNNAALIKLPTI